MKSRGPDPPRGAGTLVIGYGSTLRRDDVAGRIVAEALAARNLAEVTVLAVHQLTPELADNLSRSSRVVFLDAQADGTHNRIQARILPPTDATSSPSLGHASDPASLLALTEALYGTRPEAWLLTIPSADLSLGEGCSDIALRGIQDALCWLSDWLAVPCDERPVTQISPTQDQIQHTHDQ